MSPLVQLSESEQILAQKLEQKKGVWLETRHWRDFADSKASTVDFVLVERLHARRNGAAV